MNKKQSSAPREQHAISQIVLIKSYAYDHVNKIYPQWYVREKCPGFYFDFHFHDFYEIILVNKGRLTMNTGTGMKTLREGDIYVMAPNEVHSAFIRDEEYLEYTFIQINLSRLGVIGNSKTQKYIEEMKLGVMAVKSYVPANWQANREMRATVAHIEKMLAKSKREISEEFAQLAACFELISTMAQVGLLSRTRSNAIRPQKDISAKVLSYIQTHYQQKITTKTMCEKFYYDESQFCRMFRRNFGMSFLEFLNSYRIKMACCYQGGNDLNMYDIARQVGFDNYSYFYRNFKKYTGKTPIEYFSSYETE